LTRYRLCSENPSRGVSKNLSRHRWNWVATGHGVKWNTESLLELGLDDRLLAIRTNLQKPGSD
jgi:hypothetical protein